MATPQPADAPTESQSADARVGDHPAGRGQPVALRGGIHVGPPRPAAHPGQPSLGVDLDGTHVRQIEDEHTIRRGGAGHVMAAAADGQ